MSMFTKLFDKNKGFIKRYTRIAQTVLEREDEMIAKTNRQLVALAGELKTRVQSAEITEGKNKYAFLDDLIPEAFAAVRETAKRTIAMRPFDVQVVGAAALHDNKIAEMKTGEGKTLVATMPVFLNALTGKGVHMVTVNDYLARRDALWMGPIYKTLGLTVSVINNQNTSYEVLWEDEERFEAAINEDLRAWPKDSRESLLPKSAVVREALEAYKVKLVPTERKTALTKDVVYGTNNEFGFDYLRDNMVYEMDMKVQRNHFYAIVDEVDSILIDEARTPLIISGATRGTSQIYSVFARLATGFKKDADFTLDEKSRTVTLTEEGVKKGEKLLKLENLYDPANIDQLYHILNALNAIQLYKKDVDYIVNEEGEVIIVDEFTGRLMPGRRFSGGLHQALEAKEHLRVQEESLTYATITFQNFFRMYEKLAGMTGTAKTEEEEFEQIYHTEVVVVPTNMPIIREDFDDEVYRSQKEKYGAIIKEIAERHKKGQPVLVGTTSIEKNEFLSRELTHLGLPHQVLNAKYHEKEAEIIALAGEKNAITIATNMAGRGTDIKLGDGVVELGGLCVLGTERHEARRIDNQLRGRCGRQGDPGSSKFFLAVDDDLVRVFGGDKIGKIMDFVKIEEGEPIAHPLLSNLIEQAQKRVEGLHFSTRKYLLELDTVMDSQRKEIYEHRDWILSETDLSEHLKGIYREISERRTELYCASTDWDLDGLLQNLKLFPIEFIDLKKRSFNTKEEIADYILGMLMDAYYEKEKEIGADFSGLQKYLLLRVVDERWRKHLESIEGLKEGISLRAYGQKDPVLEFKREAFLLFEEMTDAIYDDMASLLLRVRVTTKYEEETKKSQKEIDDLSYRHDDVDTFNRKQRRKTEEKASNTRKRMRVKR
jgi:preprotein translocase subunit SecA